MHLLSSTLGNQLTHAPGPSQSAEGTADHKASGLDWMGGSQGSSNDDDMLVGGARGTQLFSSSPQHEPRESHLRFIVARPSHFPSLLPLL